MQKCKNIQMDNVVALAYLLKMWGTYNKERLDLSKEIWEYLRSKEIMIIAEYQPVIWM